MAKTLGTHAGDPILEKEESVEVGVNETANAVMRTKEARPQKNIRKQLGQLLMWPERRLQKNWKEKRNVLKRREMQLQQKHVRDKKRQRLLPPRQKKLFK